MAAAASRPLRYAAASGSVEVRATGRGHSGGGARLHLALVTLDPNVVATLVVRYQPIAYLRVAPIAHRTTPLGMGSGKTRFASPTVVFKLLYISEDLAMHCRGAHPRAFRGFGGVRTHRG
jgi:hypothetical protein